MGFMSYTNYNPKSHPCYQCKERNATCHGHCERERIFNENKPKKVYTSTYVENTRKVRDPFHKKGRVIRRD